MYIIRINDLTHFNLKSVPSGLECDRNVDKGIRLESRSVTPAEMMLLKRQSIWSENKRGFLSKVCKNLCILPRAYHIS